MNNVINLETSAITSKYLIFITTKVFVGHFSSWHNKLYRQEIHDLLHSPLYGSVHGRVQVHASAKSMVHFSGVI